MASNVIDKADLGLFFTVIDIFSLTLLLLVGFRSSMVVSFIQTKDENNIINIFRYFFIFTILLSWVLVIPYLKHKMGVNIHYWYLVTMMLSMGFVAYFGNLIAMYRQYNVINITTLLEPILTISWFIFAYYYIGTKGYHTLFISAVMSSLSMTSYMWFIQRKQNKKSFFNAVELTNDMKIYLKNSLISTLEFGSGIVMIYLSVVLIMHYFSLDELGDFQVVVKTIFVYMIMLFVFPIFRFIMPELSKLIYAKNYKEVERLKKNIYIFAFFVASIFLFLVWNFGELFILKLFGIQYENAYYMLLHISFFFVFVMLNAYNIAYIKASGKFLWALFIRLSGSVIVVIVFYILHSFTHSVINVVLSLIWGYIGMYIISFWFEYKLRQTQNYNM
jgi:O-antigen/teichoic acid export membrane protein